MTAKKIVLEFELETVGTEEDSTGVKFLSVTRKSTNLTDNQAAKLAETIGSNNIWQSEGWEAIQRVLAEPNTTTIKVQE